MIEKHRSTVEPGRIIAVDLSKEFRSPRVAPGLVGAARGLFHREYVTTQAVAGISLDIAPGTVVGYIGPNGAGKTTTIKLLCGILAPTAGHVAVNGLDPYHQRQAHSRLIGVMFGNRSRLFANLPVRETFSLLRQIYEIDAATYQRRMKRLVDILGIEPLLDQPVRELSLGQRVRCELTAVFLHDPPVLFLDEPTIGLDVAVKADVRAFIQAACRDEGKTVVLTSHDVSDIEQVATVVMVIDSGRLLFQGTVADLRRAFGSGERDVVFDLADPVKALAETLPSAPELFTLVMGDETQLRVRLARAAALQDILAFVNAHCPVRDMHIHEEAISEVVRRIYARQT